MATITWLNKIDGLDLNDPQKNVTAADMNEIKSVTNTNAADLDTAESTLASHVANTSNPHSVTKTQVGLSDVNNTSDAAKPVSTAQQTALDLKISIASLVFNETPTGLVNGINMTYTMANAAIAGTVIASADAQPLREGFDFNISGTTLTMTWPPEDWIRLNLYMK